MEKKNVFMIIACLSIITIMDMSLLPLSGSAAEKFPSREIIISNPYGTGGGTDLPGRVLTEYLQKELKVPVVFENRTEAGGVKGVMDVYKGRPDGHLLLLNTLPRNAQMEIVYNAPFKILDMTYLAAFVRFDMLLTVNKESPYKTLKELIDGSKRKSLNCSIAGMGSRAHLVAMMLKKKLGINYEVVPFKGQGPAMLALLGGHVDLTVADSVSVQQNREKLRPLALFYNERSDKFPDIPTFKELGHDLPIVSTIAGISAPPRLPEDIRKVLSDALTRVIKDKTFINKLEQLGASPMYLGGPEFRNAAVSLYKLTDEYKDLFKEGKK